MVVNIKKIPVTLVATAIFGIVVKFGADVTVEVALDVSVAFVSFCADTVSKKASMAMIVKRVT